MALFLGEMTAKSLDENCLRNYADVKKHEQSDQTKTNIPHVDLKEGPGAATHCGEAKGDNYKGEEKGYKNRVPPDPPIALLNFPNLARQTLISLLYRRFDGMNGRGTHGAEV